MSSKKILIFTYTDITRDPIVLNQIKWLSPVYDLYVVCSKPNNLAGVNFIKYPSQKFLRKNLRLLLIKLGLYGKYLWSRGHKELVSKLSGIGFDLIIVHHLKLLPLAFNVTPKSKVLFYAHEYYMHMYDDSLLWRTFIRRYFLWLAEEYLSRCDYIITVNQSIKNLYEKNYNIKADFIHNAADFTELEPSAVNREDIKIVHHGLASSSRYLELMISIAEHLDDRFSLTLVLKSNGPISDLYIRRLKNLASGNPRILFREPVSYSDIIQMGNEYDIGLFFMPPANKNVEFSLGHKVFQFIQSRLMLAISPLPEMQRIVNEYGLGICADNFNPRDMADKINKLSVDKIAYYKRQSHKHAKELGNAFNRTKFLELINTMISNEGKID